jgi:hypothetical protein
MLFMACGGGVQIDGAAPALHQPNTADALQPPAPDSWLLEVCSLITC